MALRRYRDGDFDLTEALETDPEVMRELGGPIDRSRLPGLHRRRLEEPWWFTIALGPGGPAVGTIGIWPGILDGAAIHETGWLLLPAFHGRGIAGAALDELIARAGTASAFASLHAFPAVTNAPSNALCQRSGFILLGRRAVDFRGHDLECNHWRLPLTASTAPASTGSEAPDV